MCSTNRTECGAQGKQTQAKAMQMDKEGIKNSVFSENSNGSALLSPIRCMHAAQVSIEEHLEMKRKVIEIEERRHMASAPPGEHDGCALFMATCI